MMENYAKFVETGVPNFAKFVETGVLKAFAEYLHGVKYEVCITPLSSVPFGICGRMYSFE